MNDRPPKTRLEALRRGLPCPHWELCQRGDVSPCFCDDAASSATEDRIVNLADRVRKLSPLAQLAKDVTDALSMDVDRLTWLEIETKRRSLAIEYVKEGDEDGPGYRITSENRVGGVFPDLRTAIDAWREGKPHG